MSPLHRSWLADEADEARRTITAPELRPVGQVPCVPTSTGLLIGCAYRRPMPQPSADAERIQSALLAKDRPSRDGWKFWLTLLACVLVFVLTAGCSKPTDLENPEKHRQRHQRWKAANPDKVNTHVSRLTDAYVRNTLSNMGVPRQIATPELIALKREQLAIKRMAREQVRKR